MPTKAEIARDARIAERKKEAEKKDKELKEKTEKLRKRLEGEASLLLTKPARVNMLNYGVIVEVVNVVQAKLAQDAGFTAICPFDNPVPLSSNKNRNPLTSDPRVMRDMMNSVVIPVMAKVRIGHIVEALMAEKLGANIIDESDYVGQDNATYMEKKKFKVPFMCTVVKLEDCLLRIEEGATMLRTKEVMGQNFSNTLSTIRAIFAELKKLKEATNKDTLKAELVNKFQNKQVMEPILDKAIADQKLPVPFFGCGWVCTPNDVAMLRKLGCGAIISNIAFRADNPRRRLKALVQASKDYNKADKMVEWSIGTSERPPAA
ncbi:Pyridoxal 5'-phosphate synthase subunit snz1 [Coemansia sp. RSA 922]|nr:Pyridoxal 5'-phosphate synthase subunit snz1 [Coemansia sp. S17]KAJ2032750.1 Pyridoxal 5'-phosphate synthase subunit snz1 [Coemansia sp. S3946]KAJ2047532.1 Pyridoxal 5'-phosphate synthase subunit snz1 [Coemansia sp. S16]KAJ2058682.1 Pyridoxal 5'-phosphate synthase subunit snz1 [Coemansia sp. S2]KAJ2066159.1 Pyridoxal 5'-phosphate synthase subunit snz1 [Coemansia sp. S155-1]KAJ2102878.1 Pyridoxal 5'-phosphate synthase subunit snz1 [Coemansia sp. S100]KAJ2105781.1 Pyridoxal 5'-phosphate synt